MLTEDERPPGATAAVLAPSAPIPQDAVPVVGPNFEGKVDLASLLQSYNTIGFQASSFGEAVNIVNQMVSDFREILFNLSYFTALQRVTK